MVVVATPPVPTVAPGRAAQRHRHSRSRYAQIIHPGHRVPLALASSGHFGGLVRLITQYVGVLCGRIDLIVTRTSYFSIGLLVLNLGIHFDVVVN